MPALGILATVIAPLPVLVPTTVPEALTVLTSYIVFEEPAAIVIEWLVLPLGRVIVSTSVIVVSGAI